MRNSWYLCGVSIVALLGCKAIVVGGPGGFTKHVPPSHIVVGEMTTLVLEFKGKRGLTDVVCHYRKGGTGSYTAIPMPKVRRKNGADFYECTLPPFQSDTASVEYYIDSKCDGVYSRDYDVTVPVIGK